MKRKVLSLIFSALIFVSLLWPASAASISEKNIQSKMDAYMAAISVNGTPYWNASIRSADSTQLLKEAADRNDYLYGITTQKCLGSNATAKKTHTYDCIVNQSHGCTSNIFGGGAQCHGFALYLCYVLYGTYPISASGNPARVSSGIKSNWIYYTSTTTFPGLQTGDLIRYYNTSAGTHTAVVYSINNDGSITVVNCNNTSNPCVIRKQELWQTQHDKLTVSDFQSYYNAGKAYICRYNSTGNDFDLPEAPPTSISVAVTTSSAESVVDTSAVLHGSVKASGAKATEVGMYLGTTASNMTKLGSDPVNSYSPNMWYSTEKYGRTLTPGTTYYYRAYAIVNGKTYYGDTATFTTTGSTETASIELSKSTLTIQDNVCDFLTATTTPADQNVSWSSSNTSVATVEDGMITGLKAGTTTITASITYNGKVYSDTCRVTVTSTNGITLNETAVSMKDGETLQLRAYTTPANKTVYWKSSDNSVAVVTSEGLLKGVNAGQATITAYFNIGSETYTTTCDVTVTPSVETPSVSISEDSITIADNAYAILIAHTVPNNRSVTWMSSDTGVATVRNGTVTAVSPGTTVITVSMTYNGVAYSDTCMVTVERIQEELIAPVLSVSKTQLIAGESFTASWTKSASDAVYYTNVSGQLADGSIYMEMGRDTTNLSSTLGADWEPGTYDLHVVARNDYGQIKSNVVTIEMISDPEETPDPSKSTLQIINLKLPSGDLRDGDRISLSGAVKSNYAISEITISVYDTKSGSCIYSQSYWGDGSLSRIISDDLAPAVKAANYASSFKLMIQASDISGKQVSAESSYSIAG